MGVERESHSVPTLRPSDLGRTGLKRESPSMIPRRIGVTNIVLRVSNLCRLGLMWGVPRTADGLNGVFPTGRPGLDRYGECNDVRDSCQWGLGGSHPPKVLP